MWLKATIASLSVMLINVNYVRILFKFPRVSFHSNYEREAEEHVTHCTRPTLIQLAFTQLNITLTTFNYNSFATNLRYLQLEGHRKMYKISKNSINKIEQNKNERNAKK